MLGEHVWKQIHEIAVDERVTEEGEAWMYAFQTETANLIEAKDKSDYATTSKKRFPLCGATN